MRFLLLDGREVVEIPLDAIREVVAVGANDLELCLASLPLTSRPRSGTEGSSDPGPLRDDESRDGAGEQCSEHQAHSRIVARPRG